MDLDENYAISLQECNVTSRRSTVSEVSGHELDDKVSILSCGSIFSLRHYVCISSGVPGPLIQWVPVFLPLEIKWPTPETDTSVQYRS
jgi:hypothetical protein